MGGLSSAVRDPQADDLRPLRTILLIAGVTLLLASVVAMTAAMLGARTAAHERSSAEMATAAAKAAIARAASPASAPPRTTIPAPERHTVAAVAPQPRLSAAPAPATNAGAAIAKTTVAETTPTAASRDTARTANAGEPTATARAGGTAATTGAGESAPAPSAHRGDTALSAHRDTANAKQTAQHTPAVRVAAASVPAAAPRAPAAATEEEQSACDRALSDERTASEASATARIAYDATMAGLAINASCTDPERKLLNEAYLLSMRAPAEHALGLGDWYHDLTRANTLLHACATSPDLADTQAARDCRTQQHYNAVAASQIAAWGTLATPGVR